jgi:hypothetical protein
MPDLVVGAIARAFHTLETIPSVNLGLLFVNGLLPKYCLNDVAL